MIQSQDPSLDHPLLMYLSVLDPLPPRLLSFDKCLHWMNIANIAATVAG
ncbi:hypothetical protein Plhal304r1_c031g0100491 [Plasmopara halstedii]